MKQGWKKFELSYFVNDFIVPQRDKPKVFDGDIPWCRIEDFNGIYLSDTKTNQYVSQKTIVEMGLKVYPINTVIVSCSADLGKCAIIKRPLVSNQTFIGLVPSENLDSKFLYYYMSSIAKNLNEMASGATIKYLSKKKFQEIVVCFPPLPEQKSIVLILDECFNAIAKAKANAEQNLKNAKELFESYLQGVFEKKGEGWEEKTLKELTTHLGDGLHGTPKYTTDGDYYFINGNNLTDGAIEFKESTKRVSIDEYNKHKKNLTNRTVLVSINGTLGNVAFYNGEKIILGKSACYFNLKENIDKGFVKYVLSSQYFINYAHREATGATIKNVSLKSMREFKVPVPPLKEQQTIVRQLDALRAETQKLEAVYQKKIADLEELKKSILQKAFEGEL